MRVVFAALVLTILFAPAASAINCPQWNYMTPQQKAAQIDRMIARAISGSGGRSMHVDRAQVERCLYGAANDLQYDLDGVCADPRKASMRAIDNMFRDYLWSCVR